MRGKDIARHEFIGLGAEVLRSRNMSQPGMKGKVIDESKNAFVILTEKKERKVLLKDGMTLAFSLPGGERAKVDCSMLVARPEDRIKMKIK